MRARLVPVLLLAIGLLQMTGAVLGLDALQGLGAVSGASPAPKVFSSVRGLETYSTKFFLELRDASGVVAPVELTGRGYAGIRGPYNRRNVLGAALAYGPVLSTDARTAPIFESVVRYALCGDAPLLAELGLEHDPARGALRIRLEPRPGTDLGDLPDVLDVSCEGE